jgi:hypothetical protein
MSNKIELRIAKREPFADGHEFGPTGAYERITGRAHFAVDPSHPAQSGITDLDKAPTNADGLVEFVSDVIILKPADPSRGNKRVFFDYGNRGNLRAVQFFNDAPATDIFSGAGIPWFAPPGRATCCRATAACSSTCRLRPRTASR